MSIHNNIDQIVPLEVSRSGLGRRLLRLLIAVLPWAIIAGLLWAGLFIKPKPVGFTVTPPLLERRDQFYGLALSPAGDVWVGGSQGKILAISSDGNIRRMPTPTERTLQDLAIWDASHAVAVGNDGVVIYSADGGKSWQAAREVPRSQVANKLNRVRIAASGLAIATGEMGALLISRDYGQSWQRLREEEDVAWNDVAILSDGRLVVVGEFGRILLGDEQGKNWEEVTSPVASSLMSVQFRDARNGVAVGLEGVLLITRDGGRQWDSVEIGITDHLFDVLWDEEHQRWFASGALGRWVSGRGDVDTWQSGALDSHNLSWHTRALPVGASMWLVGADVGHWDGHQWSPVTPE